MSEYAFLREITGGERVSVEGHARAEHAGDWGTDPEDERDPDAVVWPASTAEVSAVLAAADERGLPVTPYAAGTALEGHVVPAEGGITMDLSRMDAILDVRPDDLQVDVQPGVIGSDVDERVARHGLFFPPLPSSGDISTIGGMIATDASGMGTVRYGEVGDWVLGLEAVLPDGTVITTGSRARKTSAGYNLGDLLVGSEGTLGVVTRATLELAGRPQQIRGGRAVFSDLGDAAGAVFDAVRSGVDVAKIELVDGLSATMANAYLDEDLPEKPMVFVEFHADHGIEEEIDFCRTVFREYDPAAFELADDDRMDDLWRARREMAYAIEEYRAGMRSLHPGDVTVPISALREIVTYAKTRGEAEGLLVPCYGHAGDGNLHYTVLVDPDDAEMVERAEAVYADVVERALELGGTATGEHGVGQGKREYLPKEHGAAAVETMRTIKRALDPNGTLNPGKVLPERDGDR